MRRHLLLWTPAVAVGIGCLCLWLNLRREHALLSAQCAALSGSHSQVKPSVQTKSGDTPGPSGAVALTGARTSLEEEIQTEELALAALRKETAALAARLPSAAEDDVIVSFGRIEDMARETGVTVRDLIGAVTSNSPGSVDLQNTVLQWMRVKGRVPEIQSFERHPGEIARFQSHALQQALDLSPAAEAAMKPLIEDAFARMAEEGLTASQRPETEPESWIAQRSRALQDLMIQLRPHIPHSDSMAARQALTMVLNLGAGMETTQHLHSPNQATLTMGVKWPQVPW
jgi:hypothetical protein